jgi:hypothetical protein
MSYIVKSKDALSVKYLSYVSASSHGKSVKKVEKRRAELIDFINETRMKINGMPSFNGDKSLRDSAVAHLKLMYSVFNEDYSKIVDMEEIAEQSYDLMEAYLTAKQRAADKLKESAEAFHRAYRDFAARNNVTLIDKQSELERKLDEAGKVSDYYNTVYLIFFRAYRQEAYLLDALSQKNTSGIEQNRNSLMKAATGGLEQLKTLKGYNSDRSIETACRKALEFYYEEAEKKIPVLSDFIVSADNFEQVKQAFEARPSDQRTKEIVNSYNKSVEQLNRGANNYNAVQKQLFDSRSLLIAGYNSSVDNFLDTHMP